MQQKKKRRGLLGTLLLTAILVTAVFAYTNSITGLSAPAVAADTSVVGGFTAGGIDWVSAAGKTAEEQYASLTEGVKRAADLVAVAKLTLLVEPLNSLVDHPGCFLASCVDGLKLVREINLPHVRLLFDIYHEQVMRGNVIRTLTEAAPYVSVFHVADNPGRNDPGTGEIDYPNVYKAIQKTGYTGYIGMEYHPLGTPLASFTKAVNGLRAALTA